MAESPNPKLAAMFHPYSMGETAENVARKYKLSREEQDRFAYESQMKCKAAMEGGRFADEIVPVEIPQRKGSPSAATGKQARQPSDPLGKRLAEPNAKYLGSRRNQE